METNPMLSNDIFMGQQVVTWRSQELNYSTLNASKYFQEESKATFRLSVQIRFLCIADRN